MRPVRSDVPANGSRQIGTCPVAVRLARAWFFSHDSVAAMRLLPSLVCVSILAVGCDGSPVNPDPDAGREQDAGTMTDAGYDAGPPFACTEPTRLDAVLDDTVSVMFDTAMTETRPRDLGLACGNLEGELR